MKLQKETSLRKIIIIGISIIAIFLVIFFIALKVQYRAYSKVINDKINMIISRVIEEYPEIKEEDILEIINSKEEPQENILQKYGYDEDIANINAIKTTMEHNITQNIILLAIFGVVSLAVYTTYVLIQEKKIREINDYLRQLNNGNYTLKIEDNGEGEFSKLRNELYKTTVLLKEAAENSEKEKEQLSNSLADISHQIKTPLTSMRILLDNLADNPDMEPEVRKDFIREISKQVDWISSLVISLLKMAKFDAGTIKMENSNINAKKLIDNVLDNLSILIEIKEIEVITKIDEKASFIADYKWQLEAITNIVKNAIEHSMQNSKIYITVENTSMFLKIKVRDEGKGISKKDRKHIFERFYKSRDSQEGNVGIGLPLAKTIIEQNNGYIKVDSEPDKGTTFEIKYMK